MRDAARTLFTNRPLLHGGRTFTLGIHVDLGRFLDETVRPGQVTLETGSGLSTIILLGAGVARHIAVTPAADEVAAIRTACAERGIPTEALEPVLEGSQDYLPRANLPSLDLVLIDGDHAFPTPFVDWYYTADRLQVGGWMVVDDTQLVTGRILADFMRADPKWREALRHPSGRFAVYQKLAHPIHDGSWMHQPYVQDTWPVGSIRIRRDRVPGPVERLLAHILPWRLIQEPLRARFNWPRAE
jgi:Methyltransferase domain